MQPYEIGTVESMQSPEHTRQLLRPCTEQLGIFHPDFQARYKQLSASGISPGARLYSYGLVTRMSDSGFGAPTSNQRYLEDRDTLINSLAMIKSTLRTNPNLHTEDTVDWGGLAQGLVEEINLRNMTYFQSVLDTKLQAAFCCSLLDDNTRVRQQFIRAVYGAGIASHLARAIRNSPLFYIDGQASESDVYQLNYFADAFEVLPSDIETYIKLLETNETITRSDARAKQLGRAIRHAYEQGYVSNELLAEARQVELTGNDAEVIALSPYKIESFALQEALIQELVDELFGSTTVQNSPFARALQEMRGDDVATPEQLRTDIRVAVENLSAPIVEQYKLPYIITGQGQLSQRQVKAMRFREIIDNTNRLGKVAHYVSYRSRPSGATRMQDIYTISHVGAAAPEQVETLLDHLMHAALVYKDQTGDTPTTEELYRLTLSERKYMIRLAMNNVRYLNNVRAKGYLSRGNPAESIHTWQLYRDATGRLKLQNPLAHPDVPDVPTAHNGVTIGCPAVKVSSHTIQHETRLGSATNNFVDYIIEAAIHEAYARGIFQLTRENVS